MPTKTTKAKPKTTAAEPGEFQPVRISRTAKPTAEPGVPLFVLTGPDGTDQVFTVPARVSRGVVLEFVRIARTDGEMAAAQRALERLLGPDAYAALEQSDELEDEHLEQLLRAVIHHMAGVSDQGND